jgi:hypothetical protein
LIETEGEDNVNFSGNTMLRAFSQTFIIKKLVIDAGQKDATSRSR